MMENLTPSEFQKVKKVQIWLEFQYYGWFGMFFENIQVEPPKEARGHDRC